MSHSTIFCARPSVTRPFIEHTLVLRKCTRDSGATLFQLLMYESEDFDEEGDSPDAIFSLNKTTLGELIGALQLAADEVKS